MGELGFAIKYSPVIVALALYLVTFLVSEFTRLSPYMNTGTYVIGLFSTFVSVRIKFTKNLIQWMTSNKIELISNRTVAQTVKKNVPFGSQELT